MAKPTSFRLPFPPSVNSYWRHGPRGTYMSAGGKRFRSEAVADIWNQLGLPKPLRGRLRMLIELTPPNRCKRDLDNHLKATLDAIQHAQVIEDDEQFDEIIVRRLPVESPGCCDITIIPIADQS